MSAAVDFPAAPTGSKGFFRWFGRLAFYGSTVGSLIWKGSAIPFPFLGVCILAGLTLMLATTQRPRSPAVGRYVNASLAMAAALAAFALLQSIQFPANPLANAAWDRISALFSFREGAVSVNPASTRQAILTLIAPFLIFASALLLFERDEDAIRLIKFLALVGIAFALFGIVQITAFTHDLMFFEKVHYLDSLTSVFVNRNTAGTLLGVASFAALAWLLFSLQPHTGRGGAFLNPTGFGRRRGAILAGLALAGVLLALFLTKSRGAMLSAIPAYLVTIPLLFGTVSRAERQASPPTLLRKLSAALFAVALVGVVVALFGGLTSLRLQRDGIDVGRLCLYSASLRAFADNWLLGTGFGTFESVFPAYRDASCGPSQFIFIRAHNFFLEGLLGFGVFFVPVVLIAYGFILRALRTGYRTRRRFRNVAVVGFGAVLFVTIHSMVDFSLQIPGMGIYFAAFLAPVIVICLNRADALKKEDRAPLLL